MVQKNPKRGTAITISPLPLATRVRVRRDAEHGPGPWPNESIGTIIASPIDDTSFTWALTIHGPEIQYWISFDEAQRDVEGDGPYTVSQVLARYVEPLAESGMRDA